MQECVCSGGSHTFPYLFVFLRMERRCSRMCQHCEGRVRSCYDNTIWKLSNSCILLQKCFIDFSLFRNRSRYVCQQHVVSLFPKHCLVIQQKQLRQAFILHLFCFFFVCVWMKGEMQYHHCVLSIFFLSSRVITSKVPLH